MQTIAFSPVVCWKRASESSSFSTAAIPSGGNGITNWDSHSDILKTHAMQAEIMDQPTAALIADLKQRGMLEHTLVVWCTEFGRMPFLQANGTGRDHNPDAFTCFLAGAGVKKGFSYGESDEFGFKAAVNETSVYDFNATLLHLMGLDHERSDVLPQRARTTTDQCPRTCRERRLGLTGGVGEPARNASGYTTCRAEGLHENLLPDACYFVKRIR